MAETKSKQTSAGNLNLNYSAINTWVCFGFAFEIRISTCSLVYTHLKIKNGGYKIKTNLHGNNTRVNHEINRK